jgi:hypothetical protein
MTLKVSGVTNAQLKDIQIRVNGRVIQEFNDADEIAMLNDYYKRGSTPGYVDLWFIRPELVALKDQRMTALGTMDVQTLDISIDIDGAAANPVIEAYAVMSEPAPLGVITKVKRFPLTFAAGGEQDISNLPMNGARIGAIHLQSSLEISKARVVVNNVDVFEADAETAAQVQNIYQRVSDAASSVFHIDWMLEGDLSQALITQGVQDFRIKPTLDAGGQVNALVEYLDGFNGV